MIIRVTKLETREAIQRQKEIMGLEEVILTARIWETNNFTEVLFITHLNFAVSLWADGFHFLRAKPHPTGLRNVFDNFE